MLPCHYTCVCVHMCKDIYVCMYVQDYIYFLKTNITSLITDPKLLYIFKMRSEPDPQVVLDNLFVYENS